MSDTDRIEKKIHLRAPRARVWRALANAEEFGTWFRMKFEGTFAEGKTVKGQPLYPGFEHKKFELAIERLDPERLFSYRWHPYPMDPAVDYSTEPPTLVEFRLEDAPGGTLLTVVESGFDRLPATRRAEAFRMNDGGWTEQMKNIERHVSG
ncbi:MAG TPA: SRPBCC family protein [Polyangia bacterium]|nr:SRPBCC family protein [Polyangia bacterium]